MTIPPQHSTSVTPSAIVTGGANPVGQAASPIADLTYRNYDGPLQTRAIRWWIVALSGLRQAFRRPGFWVGAALCALPYFFLGLTLYFRGIAGMFPRGGGANIADTGGRFAFTFFQVLPLAGMLVFIVALVVGAGSIAADNNANALLVYLSKPLTKGDYLLGKWVALFLLISGALMVPSLALYVYCLLMFVQDGFLRDEPLLLGRIVLACCVPGALYASLLVGISAWSKSGRVAGSILAAVYFLTLALSGILFNIFTLKNPQAPTDMQLLLQNASLQGLVSSLSQHIYGLGTRHIARNINIPAPPLIPLLLLFGILVAVGIGAARAKIKAVEVVRG